MWHFTYTEVSPKLKWALKWRSPVCCLSWCPMLQVSAVTKHNVLVCWLSSSGPQWSYDSNRTCPEHLHAGHGWNWRASSWLLWGNIRNQQVDGRRLYNRDFHNSWIRNPSFTQPTQLSGFPFHTHPDPNISTPTIVSWPTKTPPKLPIKDPLPRNSRHESWHQILKSTSTPWETKSIDKLANI